MVIKNPKNKYVSYKKIKNFGNNHVRLKWLLPMVLGIIAVAGFGLISVYYGMYLHKTGQSMTLRRWALSLAHHKLNFIPNYISGLQANPERLNIDVKFTDFQKLAFKREEALTKGILISASDDWVPAKLRYRGETYKIEMRLKGETPDHWRREDWWSYKIKIKGNKSILGMKRFALQDPRTRFYLNEWYFHKLQEYYDLIHLRYDFVAVTVNGKNYPIYAIEENFEKRLIENNRLREGPIIKFDTWYNRSNKQAVLPSILGAAVDPYQQNKLVKNASLSEQFNVAKNLIQLYRQYELPVSKVFDVVKLARFFALCDLLGYRHATSLDNLRFYYNPITSLIEPIGYDFNEFFALSQTNYSLLGAGKKLDLDSSRKINLTRFREDIFRDVRFFKEYVKSLEEVSQKSFLDDFFAQTEEEAQEKLQILHKSYPWYNFDEKPKLYANQKYIKDFLSAPRSLQIYYDDFSTENRSISLKVRNIHLLPIKLLNIAYADSIIFWPNEETILQPAIESEPISVTLAKFNLPDNFDWKDSMTGKLKVNYRIVGASRICDESIYSWPYQDDNFIETDFMRQSPNIDDFDFISVDEEDKAILIDRGNWKLSDNLIIPSGYQVIAGEGLTLDLSNSAKILSYSPITFVGSEENPILIQSSDSTGHGIVIMKTDQESLLKYVRFENLANPSQHGWQMTGAVTFYESPVKILNCVFTGNRSEDALNIFRTKFEIDNTLFSETKADAFDGDFIVGKISNSSFVNCGNDAIDVSGSILDLYNIFINGIGDKGLSAGENSRMTAKKVDINNSELAVTSKDRSDVVIEDVNLSETRVAFIVFQKKAEFGPASLTVSKAKMENVSVPYLLENGSRLVMNKKAVEPSRENIKDILYGVEYGKSSK